MTSRSAPDAGPGAAAVAALQTALATEHAAVWAYGVVSAYTPADLGDRVGDAAEAHRARRDATERLLSDAGLEPVPAEPAYRVPAPVTDRTSALMLALTAETDTAAAWRSVVERSEQPGIRTTGLDALIDAAVRASGWRAVSGAPALTVPFPGAP